MSQLKAIQDPLLTGVSSAYIPPAYISESILPVIPSLTSTGLLAKYGTNHLRIEVNAKAGRGAYRRVEAIARSQSQYSIEGHGLEGLVTDSDYRNVQNPYDAERDEALGLSTLLWLEKEKALADTIFSTSIIGNNTTLTGANQFSDTSNSDPLGVSATARSTVYGNCGMEPNLCVMSWDVWNILRFHPAILDALGFKQNRAGMLSNEELASALGVDKVLVGKAKYESAKEGQTSSLASVWGKDMLFCVAPDRAVPYQVSLGYLVQYSDMLPRKVYKYAVNNPPNATGILVEDNYDMFISNSSAAYLIKAAVA